MENVVSKKRNPIIAALLSIILPGLGQVYNGQLIKGIIFYILILLPLILTITGLLYQPFVFIAVIAFLFSLYLFIIGDALVVAIKRKELVLKPYNKWYFYLLIVILHIGISEVTYHYIITEEKVNKITDRVLKAKPHTLSIIDAFGVKAYNVASNGMAPTLLKGDHLMVTLKEYKNNEPRRGDIIVFRHPVNPKKDFLKRVIAIENDILESRDKVIYLNGGVLLEPYVQHINNNISSEDRGPRDNFDPLVVPKGKVFVMGDNRDRSFDSRYFGFIDISDIRGKPLYIYWSKYKGRIGMKIK